MKKQFVNFIAAAAIIGVLATGCYSQGEATGSDTSAADSTTAVTDTSQATPVTDTASAPVPADNAQKDTTSKM